MNAADAICCSDCGAPLSEESGIGGTDGTVYNDLARANLLRMRGDYKPAADVCLSILKKHPNNATAHTLLGDIYAEQGDLKQAAEWYEIALDVSPDSIADKNKLATVRERMAEKEAAATAQQIGIPQPEPKGQQKVALMTILIIVVGVAAFFVGGMMQRGSAQAPGVINTPIDVEASGDPTRQQVPEADPKGDGEITPSQSAELGPAGDDAVLARLRSSLRDGKRILSASEDPRGPYLLLTVRGVAKEAPDTAITNFAVAAFEVFPNYSMITVRVVQGAALVMVADVTRAAYEQAEETEGAVPALSNRWPEPSEPEAARTQPADGAWDNSGG